MSVSMALPEAAILLSATSIFYFLFIPVVFLWYVYWRITRKHFNELAENLPGPKGWPIIGNALDLTGSAHGNYYN